MPGFGTSRCCRTRPLQCHHAHPEHRPVADIDLVFADEVQPAVVFDPEDGEARGDGVQGCAVSNNKRHDVRGNQQAAARVDMKSSAANAARMDVLDQARLAGRRVDRIGREFFSAPSSTNDLLCLLCASPPGTYKPDRV